MNAEHDRNDDPEAVAAPTDEGHATEAPTDPKVADDVSHQAVGIGVVDADEGRDHFGQDEGRQTLTAGEAQRESGGLGSEQEQRLPAMSQNDAPAIDKVAGIVAQTRQDVGTESAERIAEVLTQRLEQSGVPLPEADVRELASQISTGDAAAPDRS